MDEQKQKNEKEEGEDITDIDTSIEEKTDEKEQFENKLRQAEEQAKRYLADYQNLQRRAQQEKFNWIQLANKELLLKLLPVLDTLMLAQKHINDKGLQLSVDQFLDVLKQEHVERIKTIGEKFDPQIMEAIGTTEGKKDIVAEEARAGYRVNDQVLRSAQVIVGGE